MPYSQLVFPVQSLHRACSYPEAMKVSCQIENQAYQARVCINVLCVHCVTLAVIMLCMYRLLSCKLELNMLRMIYQIPRYVQSSLLFKAIAIVAMSKSLPY